MMAFEGMSEGLEGSRLLSRKTVNKNIKGTKTCIRRARLDLVHDVHCHGRPRPRHRRLQSPIEHDEVCAGRECGPGELPDHDCLRVRATWGEMAQTW